MDAQVTIGMPVFNDVKFIEESLDCILNQTFTNYILIISDDGSTDGSGEICLKYAREHSKINYVRQPKNLGISKNMEFLLSQAETPYFMWAGDDDLMEPDFIEVLLLKLKNDYESVGVFTTYQRINDNGSPLTEPVNFDYSGNNPYERLKKFISNADDIWGYGLFKTEKIRGVKFPIWWWPNKKQSYNNIFPSLCFYLARGNYSHIYGHPRFLKRDKSGNYMNHSSSPASGLIETIHYIIRRFYLVGYSIHQIGRAKNYGLAFRTSPFLFYNWFICSTMNHLKLVYRAQLKKLSRA